MKLILQLPASDLAAFGGLQVQGWPVLTSKVYQVRGGMAIRWTLRVRLRMNVAGVDEQQDGAITGGPFSALCESMRPGEEEGEAGEEGVATKDFFTLQHLFQVETEGWGPNAQPLYRWDEFGFRVEEEDGPEDTSSKLLSIPFTEVFSLL